MRKWIIWFGVIGVLAFLTIRIFTNHIRGVKDEKKWYLERLGFEFSGKVYNHDFPEKVLFRVTDGELDAEKEKTIKEELQYNGVLELLLYRYDGRFDLMILDPHKYIDGDSIYLNSRLSVVRFYRSGELIGEHDLIKSLRGRPF